MKRISVLLLMLFVCVCSMMAVPAHPGSVRVQQPDGSFVTLCLHGDEWAHYQTTVDGYTVVKDSRDYYVYAELQEGRLQATSQVAHDLAERSAAERTFLLNVPQHLRPEVDSRLAGKQERMRQQQHKTLATRRAAEYDYNKFKGLIILVQYKDKEFSRSDYRDIMEDMVNKDGYTGYDDEVFTGSVRDYYSDNSLGKFQPHFDIVGPVTINYSQYAPRGTDNVEPIINAAIDAADPLVDFSEYDGDDDGTVDLLFFIFAGNGANYSGNDSRLFWPHRYVVIRDNNYVIKDGVTLWDYASSTELKGWTNAPNTVMIDGIGTICHEFSHVLGLPDFYDTDYERSGGQSNHPGIWSVMASGCYENDSRTPVGYSLFERFSVGFMDEIPTISAEGSYTLDALYKNNAGFRIETPVEGEFFLFENRQHNSYKWDEYLPGSGMLVHRVDQSDYSYWQSNSVNAAPYHNCYEVVRAGGTYQSGTAGDLFPGPNQVQELSNTTSPANLKTRTGKKTKWALSAIAMNDDVITFDIIDTDPDTPPQPQQLTSLSVDESLTLDVGVTQALTVVAEPAEAEYTLTWTTDDETIATVDQEGNVTGVAAGTCNVTVTSDNDLSATCAVTVVGEDPKPVLEGITLSETELTMEEGDDFQLEVTPEPADFTEYELVWSSDKETVATVSADGLVTAVGEGMCVITVTVPETELSATCEVTVNRPKPLLNALVLSPDVLTLEVDGMAQFTVTTDPADYEGSVRIAWLSSDESVARVYSKNTIVAHGSGHCVITAKDLTTGATGTCDVTVTETSAIRTVGNSSSTESDSHNLQGQRVSGSTRGVLIRKGGKAVNR